MDRQGYTNKQAAAALNLKPATISYYTNQGFIEPEVSNPKGRGTTRRYSRRNLVELLVVRRMVDAGVRLEAAEQLLRFLGRPDIRIGKCAASMPFDPLDPDDDRRGEGVNVFLIVFDDDSGKPAFDIRWAQPQPGRPDMLQLSAVQMWNARDNRPFEVMKAFNITPILSAVKAL